MGTNVETEVAADGDYVKLDGTAVAGMLAEENAGGMEETITNTDAREGYGTDSDIEAQGRRRHEQRHQHGCSGVAGSSRG